MQGQLPDGGQVGLIGWLSQAGERVGLDHALALTIYAMSIILIFFLIISVVAFLMHKHDQERRRSNALLNNILESLTEYSIVAKDLNGMIQTWNEGARRIYGYEAAEVVQKASAMILHDPEDVRSGRAQSILDEARHNGKWEGELTRIRKGGSPFTARVTIMLRRDAKDKPVGFTMISRDMTDQKRAETKLRNNQRMLSQAQQLGKIGGWDYDAAANKVSWTDEVFRIHELERDFDPNDAQKNMKFYMPEDRTRLAEAFRLAATQGIPYDLEMQLNTAKGRRIWVRAMAQAETQNGKVTRLYGYIIDISQQKHVEEALETVNKDLSQFAYVVSHDLKAPLRAIGSLANWVMTDYADKIGAEGKGQLTLMVSRVKRMNDMIDGILHYSRAGQVAQVREAVELGNLVNNTVDLLSPPAHIKVHIVDPLPTLWGDRTQFQQVFQNLIQNAIKFMDKPEGDINITCRETKGSYEFGVKDNGLGIDSQYFDRIFQMFQTLARRDEHESTGIGLAVVKKIVEANGGRIWLQSTLGQGSAFYFTLPHTSQRIGETNERQQNIAAS